MNTKLQELTDKIFLEGVEKGNTEAKAIVAKAELEAADIIEKAKAEAAKILNLNSNFLLNSLLMR